jgi:hypothetical protein
MNCRAQIGRQQSAGTDVHNAGTVFVEIIAEKPHLTTIPFILP